LISGNYWSSFREELVATSLVLVVAVGGSFFVLDRLTRHDESKPLSKKEPETVEEILGEVMGESDELVESEIKPKVTVSVPSPTPEMKPTENPYMSEVFYGTGGLYQNDKYTLGINSPRLIFDARDTGARKLVVNISLTNKSITAGIQTNLSATIIKDGTVIVPKAAMSVSETKMVLPGESFDYEARISLIEGTDVSLLTFKAGDNEVQIEHILRP